MQLQLSDYKNDVKNLSKSKKACIIYDKIVSQKDKFLDKNPDFFNDLKIEIQDQCASVGFQTDLYDENDFIAGDLNDWSYSENPALQCAWDITDYLQMQEDEVSHKKSVNSKENGDKKIKSASFRLELDALRALKDAFTEVRKISPFFQGDELNKLMKILSSPDYTLLPETEAFQFYCSKKQFAYLIKKVETQFAGQPDYSLLESCKLFKDKDGEILKAADLSSAKNKLKFGMRNQQLHDEIFNKVIIGDIE